MAKLTFSDMQSVVSREIQRSERTLFGVTKTIPRYELISEGIYEFLVDCYILESPNQAVILGSDGLRVIKNILVASEASGDLLADINVPVEITRNATGQLEVIGRSKVNLPSLRLDEYDEGDLGIHHVLELTWDSTDRVWRDSYGIKCNIRSGTPGHTDAGVSRTTTTTTVLSTLGQLKYDDNDNEVDLGVNPLQRTIATTVHSVEVGIEEQVNADEAVTIT